MQREELIRQIKKDVHSMGLQVGDVRDGRQVIYALHDEHVRAIDAEISSAIARAEKTAAPALETLFDDVYAHPTAKLVEQREQLLAAPRAPKHHG